MFGRRRTRTPLLDVQYVVIVDGVEDSRHDVWGRYGPGGDPFDRYHLSRGNCPTAHHRILELTFLERREYAVQPIPREALDEWAPGRIPPEVLARPNRVHVCDLSPVGATEGCRRP